MKLHVSLITAVCTLTFLPAFAGAQDQPWLRDRRYTEGIGYRVGDLELHPGLAAEFGYDSNYFRRADSEDPIGSLRLRITPSFSVSTLSKQRREATPGAPPPDFEFRGGLSATYNEFFPVNGGRNDADRSTMSDQRNLSGSLDANLAILPQRPFGAEIFGSLSRSVNPTNEGDTTISFNRVNTRDGFELVFQPGGGLLDWRLGYAFSGTFFEASDFTKLTNLEHEANTRGRWRFLPRTALMYDGRLGFVSYPSGVEKTSSHPVRARLGINGLVTNSFAILAMAGWGASFYDPPPGFTADTVEDFDSVIGQLEVKWFLTPNPSSDPSAATLTLSSIAAGFTRDFFDAYIGTFFERDRGYLNLSYFFGGRFLVVLEGGAAAIIYPNIPGHGGWTDARLDASLFGEYRFADAFGINSTVRYGHNFSSTAILGDDLQWQEFEAYLGFRWFM